MNLVTEDGHTENDSVLPSLAFRPSLAVAGLKSPATAQVLEEASF